MNTDPNETTVSDIMSELNTNPWTPPKQRVYYTQRLSGTDADRMCQYPRCGRNAEFSVDDIGYSCNEHITMVNR